MSKLKKIKEVLPGETFLDSLGLEGTVVSIKEIPFQGINRTRPRVCITYKKNSIEFSALLFADRVVEVKEELP